MAHSQRAALMAVAIAVSAVMAVVTRCRAARPDIETVLLARCPVVGLPGVRIGRAHLPALPASDGAGLLARAGIGPGASPSQAAQVADLPRLFTALGHERRPLLTTLLAQGESPNVCALGHSLLAYSAATGDAREVALLLAAGADPDKPLSAGGSSPLVTALMAGRCDTALLLLADGADAAQPTDSGLTAMHALAMADPAVCPAPQQRAVAQTLLQRGLPADLPLARRGTTALMLAALRGNRTLVEWLLQHGADAGRAGGSGDTALSIAQTRGDAEIVSLLARALHP